LVVLKDDFANLFPLLVAILARFFAPAQEIHSFSVQTRDGVILGGITAGNCPRVPVKFVS
jgi:hypothetical protein